MKTLIIIGVILVIVSTVISRFLTKRFSIDQKENIMSKKHKQIQFVGVILTVIAFIVTSFIVTSKHPDINLVLLLIPFFLIVSILRIFMEWRYNRKANRWILEIFSTLFILAIYLSFIWLVPAVLAYS